MSRPSLGSSTRKGSRLHLRQRLRCCCWLLPALRAHVKSSTIVHYMMCGFILFLRRIAFTQRHDANPFRGNRRMCPIPRKGRAETEPFQKQKPHDLTSVRPRRLLAEAQPFSPVCWMEIDETYGPRQREGRCWVHLHLSGRTATGCLPARLSAIAPLTHPHSQRWAPGPAR